ncbi:unnamed protein product [Mucor hiemalis]
MDINTKKLLTHGQASCIALSMCPTDENRKLAKDIVDASPFDVVYLQDYSPLVPVAIGKDAKSMNPFLYCSYPDTPPPEKISFEEETMIDHQHTNDYKVRESAMKQPEKNLVPITPSVSPQPQIETTESVQNDIQKTKEIILENDEVVLEHFRLPRLFEKTRASPVSTQVRNLRNREVSIRDVNDVGLRENATENQIDHPQSEVAQKPVSLKPTPNSIVLTSRLLARDLMKKAAHKSSSNSSSSSVTKDIRLGAKNIFLPTGVRTDVVSDIASNRGINKNLKSIHPSKRASKRVLDTPPTSSPSKVKKNKSSAPLTLEKSQNVIQTNDVTTSVNGGIRIRSATVEVPKRVAWAPLNSSSSNVNKEINELGTVAKPSQSEKQETYDVTSGDAIGGTRLKDTLD